ncbi:hypothetical protein B0I21_1145 [Sphingobacterium paludis]|uniref:Uncharacterized protein n=1 Tax=Sphingobacterium paludis TaxID=1476465 RepID=A0A4R7CUG6_9SPHI|nr:hypothetical protein B0I21_1145 [Sphingobacterium paludis]
MYIVKLIGVKLFLFNLNNDTKEVNRIDFYYIKIDNSYLQCGLIWIFFAQFIGLIN